MGFNLMLWVTQCQVPLGVGVGEAGAGPQGWDGLPIKTLEPKLG